MNNRQSNRMYQVTHVLILLVTAVLWGSTFVSQSIGADHVGPFTFLASRNWIAVVFLIPVMRISIGIRRRRGEPDGVPKNHSQRRAFFLSGMVCGLALLSASGVQQYGIGFTTAAKAGFITALYVILVPILSFALGRRPEAKIWVSVAIGIIGLYLLCMKPGSGGAVNRGDLMMILCALLFSIQIQLVNHFSTYIDGIRLSFYQTLTSAVVSTVLMLLTEHPTREALQTALPSILYAGIISSGIAYTLQIIGQKGLDPTIASLVMCLECVFGAIGGWVVLGEVMNARELFGCVLLFGAIILSLIRLPSRRKEAAA